MAKRKGAQRIRIRNVITKKLPHSIANPSIIHLRGARQPCPSGTGQSYLRFGWLWDKGSCPKRLVIPFTAAIVFRPRSSPMQGGSVSNDSRGPPSNQLVLV